jgi:hypothetical protein
MSQLQTMTPSRVALLRANGKTLLDTAHANKLSFRTKLSMPGGAYVPAALHKLATKTPTAEQLALRTKARSGRK